MYEEKYNKLCHLLTDTLISIKYISNTIDDSIELDNFLVIVEKEFKEIRDLKDTTLMDEKEKLKYIMDKIKIHEGISLSLYNDTEDKLTIGYGRNIEENGISLVEADMFLYNDVRSAKKDLDYFMPDAKNLSKKRYDVLIEMVFNLGVTRFLRFKRMIKAIRDADFDKASLEMLDSKWYKQVGLRALNLANEMKKG